MESAETPLRLRLILGKWQVTHIDPGLTGSKIHISLPNGVKLICDLPFTADVRLGDLLTIYTEVLADPTRSLPPPPN